MAELRRKEFDDIANGWGSDGLDDLMARCQLIAEWWAANFPLTAPELKVARAMNKRINELGGLPPPEVAN